MNREHIKLKRALISVSDKTGVVELGRFLTSNGVEIISTGGTCSLLKKEGIAVTQVSEVTGFPEIMNGRVKTLHPLMMGGILGRRGIDDQEAAFHHIGWIDLVVCNLYPFEQTIRKESVSLDEAIENIDIGGPSMIRSGAKNFSYVMTVTDPADYQALIGEIEETGVISYETRKESAAKAFAHTARYDAMIQSYLGDEMFPGELSLGFTLWDNTSLRYGENPHQKAAAYKANRVNGKVDDMSLLDAPQLQGKKLSFNNLGDTWGAIETLREFSEPACVVVKHGTPCGVCSNEDLYTALKNGFEADSLSAFGSIIAVNGTFDEKMASYLSSLFIEVLVALDFTEEALKILKKKKNLRILRLENITRPKEVLSGRFIGSDLLVQTKDAKEVTLDDLECVTEKEVSAEGKKELLFAWKIVKHVKSNAILTTSGNCTCGIGGGQVSRVDATKIALRKSPKDAPLYLASDAFFPFKDSIEALAGYDVKAIVQPGGSIRDQEVIDACNEAGIAMYFTHTRSFLHA
ncbi:MAG: bifunctional phosphoribosylaminoimidazolecarboxamide formyltransferase/IMP cyclohydrolase [Sphaerochaetaceae bacterium]|nr:bifunctional phosphoribosylaminoimidazolecarboxamide formyltransferase/IMP cyclohydrolase [Sphaerochaetaceae bacterium]